MTMSVVTSVSTVGSKKLPPCAARLPLVTTLAPFSTASAMCASTFSTAFMSINVRSPHPARTRQPPVISGHPFRSNLVAWVGQGDG